MKLSRKDPKLILVLSRSEGVGEVRETGVTNELLSGTGICVVVIWFGATVGTSDYLRRRWMNSPTMVT